MRFDATTQAAPDRTGKAVQQALAFLAFPSLDNEAVTLSPLGLWLAAALLLTAVLAFVLAWLLRAQLRKTRRLDEQLRAQRRWHRDTLDALPFGVMLHAVDGRVLAGNRASEHPGLEQVAAQAVAGIDPIADADALRVNAALPRNVSYDAEDGVHPAQLWIHGLFDGQRRLCGYATTTLDVTPFRNAQEDARQTERHLGDLAQRMPVAMLVLRGQADREPALDFIAGNTQALFNLAPAEWRDEHGALRMDRLRERIHADDLPAVLRCLSDAGDGTARQVDFRAFGREGLRWIHATLASAPGADGDVRTMVYFIDTTEQNLQNDALRVARDVAERASKAKADFLATMSHEIRTPMNGMVGMLELLGRTSIDAEQRELLQAVEGSTAALLQILNDILDFSKLEAGDLRLDVAPFDPRHWLDEAAVTMAPLARRKALQLDIAVDAGVAGQLRGDGLRLRQILLNLLGNAIKFTDRGEVSARLLLLGDNGTRQHLALVVSDTGIGIPKDKQDALFKPFSQAETWTSRRYGGTGLGLAICRQLVELMDGGIVLSSEPGAGTTLRVELHLPVDQRTVATPRTLQGRHALVRTASPAAATALDGYLRAAGMTVERTDPATPLREGMAASLLFVDEDDHRSPPEISAHVVALAASPGAQGRDAEDRTVLTAHPLTWRGLLRACQQALELQEPEPHEEGAEPRALRPAAAAAPSRGYILVAEDHPVSQRLIARQLAELGFQCDVVDNGRDALEALATDAYALLLTDGNMPQMSGYELARAWREHEASTGAARRLPIVAMTANALSSETARARDAGMDDVLSKPLQLAPLAAKLAQWLGSSDGAPDPSAEAHALRELFAQASDADLRQLRQHAERRDVQAAAGVMHRLLGVLPHFAEPALLDEGERLFEGLHGDATDLALDHVPRFAGRVEALVQRLRRP